MEKAGPCLARLWSPLQRPGGPSASGLPQAWRVWARPSCSPLLTHSFPPFTPCPVGLCSGDSTRVVPGAWHGGPWACPAPPLLLFAAFLRVASAQGPRGALGCACRLHAAGSPRGRDPLVWGRKEALERSATALHGGRACVVYPGTPQPPSYPGTPQPLESSAHLETPRVGLRPTRASPARGTRLPRGALRLGTVCPRRRRECARHAENGCG